MNTNLRQPACNVRELQKPTGLDKTMHDLVLSRPKTQATKMRYKKLGHKKYAQELELHVRFYSSRFQKSYPSRLLLGEVVCRSTI